MNSSQAAANKAAFSRFRDAASAGDPKVVEQAIDEISIARFAGGQVAEIWGVADVCAQLRQLGTIQEGNGK